MDDKIIGASKIGPKYRITLTNFVREKLKAKIGDLIIYMKDEKGNIIIK